MDAKQKRCKACGKKFNEGDGYTAYLVNREKRENAFCSRECAAKYEQENLNTAVLLIMTQLADLANVGGSVDTLSEAMLHGMLRQHRFLQSELVNVIAFFLGKYGEELDKKRFDARNEAALKQAKRMNEAAFTF